MTTIARARNYYRGYRGRRSKGKAALAVLLLLVIVAAVVVILLQRNIVYDETGAPRLDVPWKEEPVVEEEPEPELDLVIQEPPVKVDEVHAFRLPAGQLTASGVETALGSADPTCTAVVVPLKAETGTVYFGAETAVNGSVDVSEETTLVLENLLADETYYAVAELQCFHDPKAANADLDAMGLKNTGGFIFYDGNNSQWIDPAKPAARQYLCGLAAEAAAMGFDEILLTGLGYPTNGKLDKIAYGETAKNANLLTFLQEMRAVLEPYGVALSVELPAVVITAGQEEASGLVLSDVVSAADRIYTPALQDEVEILAAEVQAIREDVIFVPILTEAPADLTGNFLLA